MMSIRLALVEYSQRLEYETHKTWIK